MLKSTIISLGCVGSRINANCFVSLYNFYVKTFIRAFVFSYISVYATQMIIHGFYFNIRSCLLLVLALSIITMFSRPLLKTLSLPDGGLGFLIISFVLSLVTMYLLTVFIPDFGFVAAATKNLNILGIMLPSKHLTAWWAGVFSAILICLITQFLNWLGSGKK